MYRLTTLDGLALHDEQGRLVASAGKPLAVLAYLACAPKRSAHKRELADLLWSDSDPAHGDQSLRQTLSMFKTTTGTHLIERHGELCALSTHVETDRDHFLEAVAASDHRGALAYYKADFLPTFALPNCDAFERWAELERQQLRAAFVRCAEIAARRAMDAGRWQEAQAIARRARDADGFNERLWRLVLSSLIEHGDLALASMEATKLKALWDEDDRLFAPETARLVTIALGHSASPSARSSARPAVGLTADMVGRTAQLNALDGHWEAVRRSHGRHVHIEGPAGVGKSRLLNVLAERMPTCNERTTVVVQATISDRELSYSLASEIAFALAQVPGAPGISQESAGALAALTPSLASVFNAPTDQSTGEEALRRRTDALVELLTVVADEQPIALFVDDVHWADSSSRRILARVVRKSLSLPVLLVTTARQGWTSYAESESAHVLRLEPLTELEVTELVCSLGELPPEPWAERVADGLTRVSRGSPLLVIQTLSHLIDTGTLELAGGRWRCMNDASLDAVLRGGEALRLRCRGLPPTDAAIMLVLAAAGTEASIDLVAQVAEATEEAVFSCLARLESSGLARRVSDRAWRCAHDEIAAEVVQTVAAHDGDSSALSLRDVHARMAEALLRDEALTSLRRAGTHARAANDSPVLQQAFLKWHRLRQRAGDRRSVHVLVRDFLNDDAIDRREVDALASLVRTRARTSLLIAAGALAATALAFASVPRAEPAASLSPFVAVIANSPSGRVVSIATGLTSSASDVSLPSTLRRLDGLRQLVNLPGHPERVAYSAPSADTGEIDVWIADSAGARRVTAARGDDNVSDWSPDGRFLLISTGRWDRDWYSDLGVLDPATGAVRPLVRTRNAKEQFARWSPDGTRIAFVRRVMTTLKPDEYCVIAASGGDEACSPIPGAPALEVVAWRGPTHLLVLADGGTSRRLVELNLPSGEMRVVDARPGRMFVSPDGQWELCSCQGETSVRRVWRLSEIGDPAHARTLAIPEGINPSAVYWSVAASPWLAHLRITPSPAAATEGDVFAFQVSGADSSGNVVEARSLTWRVSDTSIAVIDGAGILRARKTGSLRVYADAGGWVSDSATIRIAPSHATQVWSSTWAPGSEGWTSGRTFGSPLPTAVKTDSGWAFWNHGDGSFSSGFYSSSEWSAEAGLSLETSVSLRVTRPAWQTMSIGFSGAHPASTMRVWDHRSGAFPRVDGQPFCMLDMPAQEGPAGASLVSLATLTEWRIVEAPAALLRGDWVRVRIDVLPDGTCAAAIDGKEIASIRDTPSARSRRFLVFGQSVDTKVLLGPVTVWTGTRGGMKWSRPR